MRTHVQVVLALVASAGLISIVHAQAKVQLEYKPQKPEGSLGGAVQFKYDMPSKSAARTAEPGSKGAVHGQGQAGFGYGSAAKDDVAGAKGAKGKGVAAEASGGKAGSSAAEGAKGGGNAGAKAGFGYGSAAKDDVAGAKGAKGKEVAA